MQWLSTSTTVQLVSFLKVVKDSIFTMCTAPNNLDFTFYMLFTGCWL